MRRSKKWSGGLQASRDQWFCCAEITGAQKRLHDLTSYFTKMFWAFIVFLPRNVLGRPSKTRGIFGSAVETSSKSGALDEGD